MTARTLRSERRATRATGAAVGAAVALVATLAAEILGVRAPIVNDQVPLLATGIPAAAVIGAIVAPSVGERSGAGWAGFVMATMTIPLADAIFVVGVLVTAMLAAPLLTDPLTAVVGLGALWLIGLVIVGLPMLVVTIPCSIAWTLIVRAVVRRGHRPATA